LPARLFLDLVEANRRQLVDAGVLAKNIDAAAPCTSCQRRRLVRHAIPSNCSASARRRA